MWNPGVGGVGGVNGDMGGSRSDGQSPKNSEVVEQPFRHPLWVSISCPGITRHPQVHCGRSMEERFFLWVYLCVCVCVFKLEDPSLNSAKRRNDDQTQEMQERKKKWGELPAVLFFFVLF